ncbi:MAG: CPBP family intramembrane metalloprotease [Pseudomonadota bacterium]|nr:CPBP family intramembrane metalloprotease [Pseudomonadota bacterium]
MNNLMMVSFVEEAFFRGFIHGGLARVWAQRRYGAEAALTTGAILLGLAHHTSGPAMVVLAAVSGIGYGLAYRRAGLQAAVLAHAVLNLVHFAGFTYPMMAR